MMVIINNKENADRIGDYLNSLKVSYQTYNTTESIIFEINDTKNVLDNKIIESFEGVLYVTPLVEDSFLWSRKNKTEDTSITLDNNYTIDNKHVTIIAGPCSVEDVNQIEEITKGVIKAGAHILRGGAYKPRTSPYDFQGMGKDGIVLLHRVKECYNIPVISEIMNINQVEVFKKYVDIIQVGARNMQNYELLTALGKINKPILLKRGMGATIEELLCSAEYILKGGNKNVILCERGIKTFENSTRNTLDLSAIPVLKKLTHLPVFVDPSHGTGDWNYVESMALAAIAAGADGIMVEAHNNPMYAKSDGIQSLNLEHFNQLITKCKKVAKAIDKEIL